jgi:hypothetical protein
MKESNKMKVLKVVGYINIAICCLVAGFCVFENNALAACGWLSAALAYMHVNDLRRYCEDWKGLGRKAVDLLHSLFGTGGQIVSVKVKRVQKKSEEEKKESKKELPDFAPKAAESFHECAKEFFHYVEEGNREFSVSHGGVTVSVSIPEDDHVLEKVEVAEGLENGAAEQK